MTIILALIGLRKASIKLGTLEALIGLARVHLQRRIQLCKAKVQETSCIGAYGARVH